MKKIVTLCLVVLCMSGTKAQFFGYPQIEHSLELFNEPIVGFNDLYVGDEGYVTFQVLNNGTQIYRGPIYLRVFEREHSYQILVQSDVRLAPGRVYEFTTVFSTERFAPFVRYFIGFEYLEDKHLVHMNAFRDRPMPLFSLHAPVINRPVARSPIRPGSRRLKESVTKRSPVPINGNQNRLEHNGQRYAPSGQPQTGSRNSNSSSGSVRNSPESSNSQRTRSVTTPGSSNR